MMILEEFCHREITTIANKTSDTINKIDQIYEDCKLIETNLKEDTVKFKLENQNLLKFKQRLNSDLQVKSNETAALLGEQKAFLELVKEENRQINLKLEKLLES